MARKVGGLHTVLGVLTALETQPEVSPWELFAVKCLEASSRVLGMFSIRLCIHGRDRLIYNPV